MDTLTRRELLADAPGDAGDRAAGPQASPPPEDALTALEVCEIVARVKAGDISVAGLADAYLRRIDRLNPTLGAYVTVTAERARADAQRIQAALRRGTPPRSARRRADRTQGSVRDGGYQDDRRLAPVRAAHPAARCRHRPAARTRGQRHARQDQHARARRRRHDDQPVLRDDAQSVGSVADSRRVERRIRGSRRCRPGRGRHRERHRRQRPHSRGPVRLRRFQADVRPLEHRRPARRLPDVRSLRAADAHRRRRRVDLPSARPDCTAAALARRARRGLPHRRRAATFSSTRCSRMSRAPSRPPLPCCRHSAPTCATSRFRSAPTPWRASSTRSWSRRFRRGSPGDGRPSPTVSRRPSPPSFAPNGLRPRRSTPRAARSTRSGATCGRCFETVDIVVTPTVPVTAPPIDGPIDGGLILRNTWPFNAAGTPAHLRPVRLRPAGPAHRPADGSGSCNDDHRLLQRARTFQAMTGWHRRRPVIALTARASSCPFPAHHETRSCASR